MYRTKIVLSCLLMIACDTLAYKSAFDLELYQSVLDDVACEQQIDLLANSSLRNQFLDASGKIPSGIIQGNLHELGDYFQCLGIDDLIGRTRVQGKYCMMSMPLDQLPISLTDWSADRATAFADWLEDNVRRSDVQRFVDLQRNFRALSGDFEEKPAEHRVIPLLSPTPQLSIGICVPRACASRLALELALRKASLGILNVNVSSVSEVYCRLPQDKPFVPADYVAIGIFSFIGALLIASTAYDLHHTFVLKRDPSEASILGRSFSVYTNTRRLLTFRRATAVTGAGAGAPVLTCVDGIRSISMMWVVVGHVYTNMLVAYVHNTVDILSWFSQFSSVWVNSAPITVDTFFLLSGMLVVYSTIGKISRGRFLRSIHLFYINRLLRMFPLLAAMVLLQASVLHRLADGPQWSSVAVGTERCRQYWWSALLHVQNYVNPSNLCLGQTWYLSVDMQLYFLAPPFLLALFGRRRVACAALAFAVVLSLVGSVTISYMNHFSATLVNINRLFELPEYSRKYYFNTLARAPPFAVGLCYGYLLHQYRDKRIRISRSMLGLLWTLSALMMLACIVSIYPVTQPTHTLQAVDDALNAFMRAAWAVALGFLVFACVQGYGGPVNWFLSLPLWQLPARLSYAVFLVHYPLIIVNNSTWVKTLYFTDGSTLHRFLSELSLAFLVAFALSLAVDAPCDTLIKMTLGGKRTRKPAPAPESKSPQTKAQLAEAHAPMPERFVKTAL